MEWLIPSLAKSMRASVRPRHEWLCSTRMARAEFLPNAVLWKGGVEGFQENSGWCSGLKQGISVCFTIRARCSSLCSGKHTRACGSFRITRQSVHWPPWQLLGWRAELRWSVGGPGVPHGQYICSGICVVESFPGIRCNGAVYGKGTSSLITCLYFTQLGPSLNMDSEGRVCKHPSSSHALLAPVCWIPLGTRLSRQDGRGKMIQNERRSSRN